MKVKHFQNSRIGVGKQVKSDLVNTFHHAIGPFLLIAQFMGVLPVSGLLEKDVTRVKFKRIYAGVALTIVLIIFGILDLLLSLNIVLQRGLKMYTASPVSFSLTTLLGAVIFFRLAPKWPHLIQHFTNTEKIFLEKYYETKESKKLTFRLRFYGALLLFGAVVEHSMYMGNGFYNNYSQIKKCNLTVNFWENFFTRERLHIFSIIDFQLWLTPFTEWQTISMTFIWNFIDIFLMLITSSLATRFGQVNKRIRQFKSLEMTDEFWFRTRMDFLSLLKLLYAVNDHLSELILLSCANNLYFICFQVFQSFQSRASIVNAIYFWYSLIFVLTRILVTLLSAASVNDTCNKILMALYEIPSEYWGVELERFYEIVSSDFITLSGKGFYFLTRKLIFGMAATIMTYELVLFDQVKDVVDRADFCVTKKNISKLLIK